MEENKNGGLLQSLLFSGGGSGGGGNGTSGWQEVNLVTVNNLEWRFFASSPDGKFTFQATFDQEIDIEPNDFIIFTIGDEVVQYHDVCRDAGDEAIQLFSHTSEMPYYAYYYSDDGAGVEIRYIAEDLTAPTANAFILNKLTKA